MEPVILISGLDRTTLALACLADLRAWPGCETVVSVGILADAGGRFLVRVIDYGTSNKRLADRAVRCVERERQRRCYLKIE